jgi:hypothetical protein
MAGVRRGTATFKFHDGRDNLQEWLSEELQEEEPEPFEPDPEDLDEIELWLLDVAERIVRSEFTGVHDELSCGDCVYAEACPDAAIESDGVSIRIATSAGDLDESP